MGFGVDFIAHFDQQGHVFNGAETGIQTKHSRNRVDMVGVVLLKLLQPGLQVVILYQIRLQTVLSLTKPFLSFDNPQLVACLTSTVHTQLLASFGQLAVGTFWSLKLVIGDFQLL